MTLTNPFPKQNEYWVMYPKKTAKVAVIEFLMSNWDTTGKGLRVHLIQDRGDLHIISFPILAYFVLDFEIRNYGCLSTP